jgi:LacI family transcriptional regulator
MMSRQKRVKNQGHRVTLKFIAEYLGLSPTTISVVLSNSPLASTIAAPTKLRIWEAVEKFRYRPNLFARSLQGKRSYSIAVLVPEIGDEFSSMLISGIESKLGEAKFNYFVESHRFAPAQIENSPDTLMDRLVEGMIFINTPLMKPMPVPVVAISDITTAGPGLRSRESHQPGRERRQRQVQLASDLTGGYCAQGPAFAGRLHAFESRGFDHQ